MLSAKLHLSGLLAIIAVAAVVGCDADDNGDDEDLDPVGNYGAVEGLETPERPSAPEGHEFHDYVDFETVETDPRRETADDADRQLRQRLIGRVLEVADDRGYAQAVDVCHDEAIELTDEVGDEFDVEIGRVSDRRRNPDNVGHGWVWSMMRDADDQPAYQTGEEFRAVKPVEIAEPCLNCHGTTDELADGVARRLDEHYPGDDATGYEVGDLRGWIWVEVPGRPD